MEDKKKTIKAYRINIDGREWIFTPEAGEALGGSSGIMIFAFGINKTLKTGTTEVNYRGAGLFRVNRHGTAIKVDLIEPESL